MSNPFLECKSVQELVDKKYLYFVEEELINFLNVFYARCFSGKSVPHLLQYRPLYLSSNLVIGACFMVPKFENPVGVLHGGVSLCFAEELAGTCSNCCEFAKFAKKHKGNSKEYNNGALGYHVSGTHIAAVTKGLLIGKASIIHHGGMMSLCKVELFNDESITSFEELAEKGGLHYLKQFILPVAQLEQTNVKKYFDGKAQHAIVNTKQITKKQIKSNL